MLNKSTFNDLIGNLALSFKFFLVSSQVHNEKNALSEAASILSHYVKIDSFKAKLLSVGGLGLLESETTLDISETINITLQEYLQREKVYFCFKIIPLEEYNLVSEDFILDWVANNIHRIGEKETWKVTINKRHSAIKTIDLINKIASNISNPVNLKQPDTIIQIEIIGKNLGISLLKPYQILQLQSYLSSIEEFQEDAENEFEFDE